MLWTTVSDLRFKSFTPNLILDSTSFKNNARVMGSIKAQPYYATFSDPDDQLVIQVKDDSLQRFTGVKVEASIRPTSKARRLNIVEGWMSFAFFVEADRSLMAGIYDGSNWVGVKSSKIKVPLNKWSSVSFEYDGISIGLLTLNGKNVGSNINMPMGMMQPRQNITIGHWPSGDSRYTFIGDIGPVRISKVDYEDFWRGAAVMLFCNKKLDPEQADALKELDVLSRLIDPKIAEEIKECAIEKSNRMLQLFRALRDGNMRNIASLRQLGDGLRQAWCCKVDESEAKSKLRDFLEEKAGPDGSPEREIFMELLDQFLKIKELCNRKGVPFDRMNELLMKAVPELFFVEKEFDNILGSI